MSELRQKASASLFVHLTKPTLQSRTVVVHFVLRSVFSRLSVRQLSHMKFAVSWLLMSLFESQKHDITRMRRSLVFRLALAEQKLSRCWWWSLIRADRVGTIFQKRLWKVSDPRSRATIVCFVGGIRLNSLPWIWLFFCNTLVSHLESVGTRIPPPPHTHTHTHRGRPVHFRDQHERNCNHWAGTGSNSSCHYFPLCKDTILPVCVGLHTVLTCFFATHFRRKGHCTHQKKKVSARRPFFNPRWILGS